MIVGDVTGTGICGCDGKEAGDVREETVTHSSLIATCGRFSSVVKALDYRSRRQIPTTLTPPHPPSAPTYN